MVMFTAHADLPLSSAGNTPNPNIKRALSLDKTQEAEREGRIQLMKAELLRSRPDLLDSLNGMDRVLLTPQAMENYLRSMLDAQNVNSQPTTGTEDVQSAASNDQTKDEGTSKVDAEMARLEELKGGNLGAGADPGPSPGNDELETTGKVPDSLNADLESGIAVAQSEAALKELKDMIQMFGLATNASDPKSISEVLLSPISNPVRQELEMRMPGNDKATRDIILQRMDPSLLGGSTPLNDTNGTQQPSE